MSEAAAQASVAGAGGAVGPPALARVDVDRWALRSASIVLGAAMLARHGLTADGLLAASLAVVLLVLSAVDLRERRLPNVIVLPSTCVVLAAYAATDPGRALEGIVMGGVAAGLLLLPLVVKPGAIGMGDVKLGLLLGVALGAQVTEALLIGLLATVPVAAALVARHGWIARQAAIPLGPFLAAGALVVLVVAGP